MPRARRQSRSFALRWRSQRSRLVGGSGQPGSGADAANYQPATAMVTTGWSHSEHLSVELAAVGVDRPHRRFGVAHRAEHQPSSQSQPGSSQRTRSSSGRKVSVGHQFSAAFASANGTPNARRPRWRPQSAQRRSGRAVRAARLRRPVILARTEPQVPAVHSTPAFPESQATVSRRSTERPLRLRRRGPHHRPVLRAARRSRGRRACAAPRP